MENKGILIQLSFYASLIISLIGISFKIYHWDTANIILGIGLMASISFRVLSIFEVANSKTISKIEKSMWIVGLILISSITGFIYILSGRKRIIRNKRQ